jgi:hypothetical protein
VIDRRDRSRLLAVASLLLVCSCERSAKGESPPPDGPPAPASLVGSWLVQRNVDPISDSVHWEAIAAADSGSKALLVIRCQRDTLSAEMLFPEEDLDFGDTILTRFDSSPADRGGFEPSRKKVARWRHPTRDLLKALSGATGLVVGRQNFLRQRYATTYSIPVSGADSALAPLRAACANAVDHRTPPPVPARRARSITDSVRFLVGQGELPFIGSRADKVAYSAFCEIWKEIPTKDQAMFVSRERASSAGYKTADPLSCRAS